MIILRIERGQCVALFDHRADVGQAGHQLAGDAERQVALVTRLDLADGSAPVVDRPGLDDDRADRPDFHGRALRLTAGKNQRKGEKNETRLHDQCSDA